MTPKATGAWNVSHAPSGYNAGFMKFRTIAKATTAAALLERRCAKRFPRAVRRGSFVASLRRDRRFADGLRSKLSSIAAPPDK